MTNRPTDAREFVRLSVDIYDNPKIAELDDPAAAWAYVVALAYAGKHLTDGVLPSVRKIAQLAGVSTQKARKLARVGLVHEHQHSCEKCPRISKGQAVIHDYLQHQRSRAEAEQQRRSNHERAKKAAAARWANRPQNTPETGCSQASQQACSNDARPMPEVEEEITTTHPGNAAPVGNAHDTTPPPTGPAITGNHSADAYRLVDRTIGRNQPSAVRTALAVEVATLLRETDTDTIREALNRWNTRTGIGPRILPNLVADIVKERSGGGTTLHAGPRTRPAGRSARGDKMRGWLTVDEDFEASQDDSAAFTQLFQPRVIEGAQTA